MIKKVVFVNCVLDLLFTYIGPMYFPEMFRQYASGLTITGSTIKGCSFFFYLAKNEFVEFRGIQWTVFCVDVSVRRKNIFHGICHFRQFTFAKIKRTMEIMEWR